MDSFVFVAVLFAALCHAGWNALIKVGLDPLSSTTLISVGAGIVGLVALPFVGVPSLASWPWLFASVVIHLFYFAALIESYRTGDLGQVYPIARGSAPLMTAVVATILIGEHLSIGRLDWRRNVGERRISFVAARRPRTRPSRHARSRLRTDDRCHHLHLLHCRRNWRAALSQSECVFGLVVCRDRDCAGALCPAARRIRCTRSRLTLLAPGPRGRRDAGAVVRHRDLGDDGGADRDRRRIARDERAVRRRDCRDRAQGAAARRPARGGGA